MKHTFTQIDGQDIEPIEVSYVRPQLRVYWCDPWNRILTLVHAGLIRSALAEPGTFDHAHGSTSFYLVQDPELAQYTFDPAKLTPEERREILLQGFGEIT